MKISSLSTIEEFGFYVEKSDGAIATAGNVVFGYLAGLTKKPGLFFWMMQKNQLCLNYGQISYRQEISADKFLLRKFLGKPKSHRKMGSGFPEKTFSRISERLYRCSQSMNSSRQDFELTQGKKEEDII